MHHQLFHRVVTDLRKMGIVWTNPPFFFLLIKDKREIKCQDKSIKILEFIISFRVWAIQIYSDKV